MCTICDNLNKAPRIPTKWVELSEGSTLVKPTPAPLYTLVLNDGNRNLSRRPGQFNDCVIRAFAILTDKDYDEVYDTFAAAGRKPCEGFDSTAWLKKRGGRAFGGQFKRVPVLFKVKGTKARYTLTPGLFDSHYPVGCYLLETPSHTWAVIDGVHHDLWRIKEQPLMGAWQWTSTI